MNPSTVDSSSAGNRVAQRRWARSSAAGCPSGDRARSESQSSPLHLPRPSPRLAPSTGPRRLGMRPEAEERGGRGVRPQGPVSKPPRGGDIPIPRGDRCVGGGQGVVVAKKKKKKKGPTRKRNGGASVLCSVPGVWVCDSVQRGLVRVRTPQVFRPCLQGESGRPQGSR